MKITKLRAKLWVGVAAALLLAPCLYAQTTGKVEVDWGKVQEVSKTTPTLQVVVNPPLRRGPPKPRSPMCREGSPPVDTSIAERTKYDLWYVENWSIWLDIKIILRTVVQTVTRKNPNAY